MQLILMPPDSFPLVMETEKERYSYTVRPSNLTPLLLMDLQPRGLLCACLCGLKLLTHTLSSRSL